MGHWPRVALHIVALLQQPHHVGFGLFWLPLGRTGRELGQGCVVCRMVRVARVAWVAWCLVARAGQHCDAGALGQHLEVDKGLQHFLARQKDLEGGWFPHYLQGLSVGMLMLGHCSTVVFDARWVRVKELANLLLRSSRAIGWNLGRRYFFDIFPHVLLVHEANLRVRLAGLRKWPVPTRVFPGAQIQLVLDKRQTLSGGGRVNLKPPGGSLFC